MFSLFTPCHSFIVYHDLYSQVLCQNWPEVIEITRIIFSLIGNKGKKVLIRDGFHMAGRPGVSNRRPELIQIDQFETVEAL